ncbi:YceI family protein [Legionella sp. km535]|uniref:YceI family protein n=1 Tax=Legionella sp. km535 TaxID=2498107 RepID=UPI000F8E8DE8|nr:YceI family protein [Legionella sp. km535]RUR17735.1 YceI family protein [Legionella sp. km535]
MKSGFYWIFGLLLVCFSYTVTSATSPQWDIIPEESELTFTGTQNNAPVTGSFKKFSGEIFVDPEHYKASSIHIVIDMTSITASYADITTTLEAPDWFDVKAFPKAEFKATQFNKIGEKTYEADGILTIRDKSAPVTLTFTAEESPKNHALVNGTASIKRSTFGVGQGEWASTDAIKDEVTVAFKITANRKN